MGRCNRCGAPLEDDTPVQRAFSGRWPYEHERPEDCTEDAEAPDARQDVPRLPR